MAPWLRLIFKELHGRLQANKSDKANKPRAKRFMKKWIIKGSPEKA
jgi:hypothetical protein